MPSWTHILGEVARGAEGARDLPRDEAEALFSAWLHNDIPELIQGALWTAYRIKGESTAELQGFVAATEASAAPLRSPSALPIVFAAYNGARRDANLLPLLALILARAGAPVLIHGSYGGLARDPDSPLTDHSPAQRVPAGAILEALGYPPARSRQEIEGQLHSNRISYAPVDLIYPQLARLLALRKQIGVRSSAHTVAKLIQPFADGALLCPAVTHPPYLQRMQDFFTAEPARQALILRGTEGEPYANPKRRPALIACQQGKTSTLLDKDSSPLAKLPVLPQDHSVSSTCAYIRQALAGHITIPQPLLDQAACLLWLSGHSKTLDTLALTP